MRVDAVDAEWLRRWRSCAHWGPDNPPSPSEDRGLGGVITGVDPRKYARRSGVPFDQGVATYAHLVVGLIEDVLRWVSERDQVVHGRLHVLHRKIGAEMGRLREAMQGNWVYAHGNPPEDWAGPWNTPSLYVARG